ncbi:P-loop NTPase family protein [Flavitalea flava]
MKLHIFGASGTGVTTLGEALSERLNIPYFDSDAYFWERSDSPFTIRRDPALRNALIRKDLEATDDFILGGSVLNWGEQVFPVFDLVVFLWLPPEIRMQRLKKREIERYGDILFSNPSRKKQFEEFIAWAADYDQATGIASRTILAHEAWLTKINVTVLEIRSDRSTEERLMLIMHAASEKP